MNPIPLVTVDPALLLRAIEVDETDRLDFAEAYLVACAESTGIPCRRPIRSMGPPPMALPPHPSSAPDSRRAQGGIAP